jgi:hypothetical protein
MEINLEITEQKETMLGILKGKMLMKDNFLYRIDDFKVEEITEPQKKSIFGRQRPVKKTLYLTSITIRGYHADGKFLGYMQENACDRMLSFFNLYGLNKVWENFNEQLMAFGYEIKRIEVTEGK